jgi:hypothetical protein
VVIPLATSRGSSGPGRTTSAWSGKPAVAAEPDGRAFVESDLRAHRNPTRMAAIRAATLDLVANARRSCPGCGAPGFRVVDRLPGLPCRWCRLPTERTLAFVYACQRCERREEARYPDGREQAEPGQCPNCNP